MALKGNNNAEKIWYFLIEKLNNPYGVAGLMGNLYAESGLRPNNLQNTFSKKFNMSDEEYTAAVDAGIYTNFAKDSAGYGLAQWTYSARKLNLYNYVKTKGVSIGDLEAQLEFLYKELITYTNVMKVLKEAKTIQEASDIVLTKYERPANQSDAVKEKRASYGKKYFDAYSKEETKKEEIIVATNYNKYINSTRTHYISNSGSDENKKYHSGKAGDQTGHEWELRSWYSRPWTHVFRYEKDPRVGVTLCNLGCAAALNNNIGYDQYQRTTYWAQLQKVNYDPSKITTPCEEDCSAGVAANVKAAGYILGIKSLQNVSSSMTSRNTVANLTKAGFTVLTDQKYLTSGKYLKPGDILLCINHHVAMNITKGSKAEDNTTIVVPPATSTSFEFVGVATSKASMNIRAEASINSKSYGTIQKGVKLNVIEVLDNDWLKVEYVKSPIGYGYTSNRDNKFYTYVKNVVPSNVRKATSSPNLEDKTLVGTYNTTGKLNVRNGAGTNQEVMITIPKGTKVSCEGKYSVYNNVKWLYITFTYKNLTWYGFASSKYLKKV